MTGSSLPSLPPRAPLPPIPSILGGRYAPEVLLGRGAIAEVWRAQDRITGTTVALKILHAQLRDSAVVVERFRREVELVRRIQHPNVLAIHELLEDAGRLILVMEYCAGGDLGAQLMSAGPLTEARLGDLVREVGGALAAAHAVGIVHRDMKPSNILIAADGFRLGDFGLARTADFSGLTTATALLGTPEYMAPEVITDGHADPRSDVYGLGVVLYEAAAGRPPFVADSPYQLMRQHIDAEPPPVGGLAPHLPAPAAATIMRALAKDPLDRFARVEDLLAAWRDPIPPAIEAKASARARCATCGGWWVSEVALCVACGRRGTRLELATRKSEARTVLVTGPGNIGDVLSTRLHIAVDQLAAELLGTLPSDPTRAAKRTRAAPRVPFRFCQGLTESCAHALAERLQSLGLVATVTGPGADESELLKEKRERMATRYGGAALGGGMLLYLSANVLFREGSFASHLWAVLVSIGVLSASYVLGLRDAYRPLLRPPTGHRQSLPAIARLRSALLGLTSRLDRSVVARIAERAEQLRDHRTAVTPVALRAAIIAEALGALDQVATPVEDAADPSLALARLREVERDRVLLRGALLGLVSRLDTVVMKLARAQIPDAHSTGATLEAALSDLALEAEGNEEVERLLAPAHIEPTSPGQALPKDLP